MMYNKVLVPLDRSDKAEVILAHIGELATEIGAQVILLEVLPSTGVLPTTAHQQYNETRQHLDATAQKLKSQGIEALPTIRYGKPAEEIVDYAQANDVDLIAMSTHGRSGVNRWVSGNVAEKVLHSTSLPLLLVRAPAHGPV